MNTCLFDLDGTLLPMDQDEFIKLYMGALCKHFAHKYDTDLLMKTIWAGVKAMVQNDGKETNETVFWNVAEQMMGLKKELCEDEFRAFYETSFSAAKGATKANPIIIECITKLKAKGYTIVAATNPFFPQVATRNRLKWAGFNPDDFDLITTYENSHFCKPNIQYYIEILKQLGKKPEECIMAGNDNQEDMCAEHLGIKGYLITDCLINRNDAPISCYWSGTFEDFSKLEL